MSARNSAVTCGAVQTVCRPSSRSSTAAISPARASRKKIRLRRGSTDTAEGDQLCGAPEAANGWLLNCLEASAWLIPPALQGVAAVERVGAKSHPVVQLPAAAGTTLPQHTHGPG